MSPGDQFGERIAVLETESRRIIAEFNSNLRPGMHEVKTALAVMQADIAAIKAQLSRAGPSIMNRNILLLCVALGATVIGGPETAQRLIQMLIGTIK